MQSFQIKIQKRKRVEKQNFHSREQLEKIICDSMKGLPTHATLLPHSYRHSSFSHKLEMFHFLLIFYSMFKLSKNNTLDVTWQAVVRTKTTNIRMWKSMVKFLKRTTKILSEFFFLFEKFLWQRRLLFNLNFLYSFQFYKVPVVVVVRLRARRGNLPLNPFFSFYLLTRKVCELK